MWCCAALLSRYIGQISWGFTLLSPQADSSLCYQVNHVLSVQTDRYMYLDTMVLKVANTHVCLHTMCVWYWHDCMHWRLSRNWWTVHYVQIDEWRIRPWLVNPLFVDHLFSRNCQIIRDPATRHFVFELSKSLYKSLDSMSSEDEQRQIARLISRFVHLVCLSDIIGVFLRRQESAPLLYLSLSLLSWQ